MSETPTSFREGPARYFLPINLMTPVGWLGGPWGYQEVSREQAEAFTAARPERETTPGAGCAKRGGKRGCCEPFPCVTPAGLEPARPNGLGLRPA